MSLAPLAIRSAVALAAALASVPALAQTSAFPIGLVRKFCFDGGLPLDGVKAMVRGVMGDPIQEETTEGGNGAFWKATATSREGASDRQAVMIAFVGQDRGRGAPEPNILRITGFLDAERALASLRAQRGLRFQAIEKDPSAAPAMQGWSIKGAFGGANKTTITFELSARKVRTTADGRTRTTDAYMFTCTRTLYLGHLNRDTRPGDGLPSLPPSFPVHV
jgi:hypothetical protein